MARVLLLTATPAEDTTYYNRAPLRALLEAAARDHFGKHSLTNDPADAEIILFAEFYGGGFHFERIRRHPFVRQFREKCFLFCSNAIVIPFLPGIYASVEKRWASSRTCGGAYLGIEENEFTTFTAPRDDLPYLFSFVGSLSNATIRERLRTLSHPRGLIRDTADEFARLLHYEMSGEERRDYHRGYADVTKATKFVLCPRGLGASTIRLYENLRIGRVPVILSDEWVPPPGPPWNEFSIQIPERDFAEIPRVLEACESEAVSMAQRARAAWQDWFADDVIFHRSVEKCVALRARRRLPEAIARWPVYLQYLRPIHGKRLL